MADFKETMKKFFNKSVEVSKDALVKAGTAVQDFSDKSKVTIKIKQLENKVQKEYALIGSKVFDFFAESPEASLTKENDIFVTSFAEINSLSAEIEKLNLELEAMKDKSEKD